MYITCMHVCMLYNYWCAAYAMIISINRLRYSTMYLSTATSCSLYQLAILSCHIIKHEYHFERAGS